MVIQGADFFVVARMRADGVIASADRAIRYLEGRRVEAVIELARRQGWTIQFNELEQRELASLQSSSAPPTRSMIALTDNQLLILKTLAAPLSPQQRHVFLEVVANRLSGIEIGDGTVHSVAVAVQRELLRGAML
jgi:hypothetical protein